MSRKDDKDEHAASGAFSFWGVGSSLMQSVTQNANSFVSTIVDTDWQKELASLKDEIKDDLQAGQATATDAGVVDAHDAARSRAAQGTAVHEAAAPGGTAFSFATLSKSLMTGTAEILEQVKHTVDAEVQSLTGDGKAKRAAPNTTPQRPRARKGKPSALEAAITAMQRDSITFCDDPDDTEGYAEYCKAFDLAAKQFDIDELLSDNAFMAELHASLVPVVVSNEDFWQRYFFRLQELQASSAGAQAASTTAARGSEVQASTGSTASQPGATQLQSLVADTPSKPHAPPDAAEPSESAPPAREGVGFDAAASVDSGDDAWGADWGPGSSADAPSKTPEEPVQSKSVHAAAADAAGPATAGDPAVGGEGTGSDRAPAANEPMQNDELEAEDAGTSVADGPSAAETTSPEHAADDSGCAATSKGSASAPREPETAREASQESTPDEPSPSRVADAGPEAASPNASRAAATKLPSKQGGSSQGTPDRATQAAGPSQEGSSSGTPSAGGGHTASEWSFVSGGNDAAKHGDSLAGGRGVAHTPPGAAAGLDFRDESSDSLAKPAAMASSDEHVAAADASDGDDESDVDEDWGAEP